MDNDLLGLMRRRNLSIDRQQRHRRANEEKSRDANADGNAIALEEVLPLLIVNVVLITHD